MGQERCLRFMKRLVGGMLKKHTAEMFGVCGIEYRMVLSMILLIKNGCGYIGNAS